MWATMESNADIYNPPSNDEGVNRVEKENGKYAFMMESIPMEYQTKRRCTLMQVGEWLDSKGYGIALPLGELDDSHDFSWFVVRSLTFGKFLGILLL